MVIPSVNMSRLYSSLKAEKEQNILMESDQSNVPQNPNAEEFVITLYEIIETDSDGKKYIRTFCPSLGRDIVPRQEMPYHLWNPNSIKIGKKTSDIS